MTGTVPGRREPEGRRVLRRGRAGRDRPSLVHDGRGGVTCYRPDGTELTDPIPTMASLPPDVDLAYEAIVPLWAGERFDLDMCVHSVLHSKN